MLKKVLKERLGLILFMLVVAVLVIWGAVSVANAQKNAVRTEYEYVPVEGNVDFEDEGSYRRAAGNDKMELYYNEANGTVQLKDLESGYVWKSVVDDEVYDTEKVNKQWASYLKSVLTVSYNDLQQRDAPPTKVFSSSDCDYLETEYLDNGVRVRYGFTQPGIFLSVEYLLEDGQFVVRIPADRIEEQSQFVITTLEILPFLGSAGDEVDGYFVYPDGSGAVTDYANADHRPASIKAGMWRTYSNKTLAVEEFMNESLYERYTATLPVFGIKNGSSALLAAFTQGAENSGVVGYPSGYVVNLNHIGFEIYTRNVFNVNMFNVSSGVGETANGKEIQRVDKALNAEDREIRYFLLNGEDADYSGMADVYREYLLATGQLKGVIEEGDAMPLSLEVIMGITKPQMILDEYVKMTSISELMAIMEDLKERGINDTEILLRSWQKDGENYPDYWPIASQLGGRKGLEELDEYLQKNSGGRVYLENNFIFAMQKNGGFSTTGDVVYDGLNLPVSASGYDTNWYLLNPQAAFERSEDFLDKLSSWSSLGAAYQYMGRIIYPDYNKSAPFTRNQTVEKWKEIFAQVKEQKRPLACEGMNQYVYESADYLYHVRDSAFGLSITDASIPFVQMVLSGLIPYSTDPGNLSYDMDIQKLKWIEYGALPNFIITNEDAINLRESDFDYVFTSTYDVWKDRITEIYQEFISNFQQIYGRQMIRHERLEDGVVGITYDNGVQVLINYNDADREIKGAAVPAKGYVITEGEVR